MDILGTFRKYIRVLRVARKPTKEEFTGAGKICSIGIALIGFIGFALLLVLVFVLPIAGIYI